jgi:electron transport complex protein RnfE
LEEALYKPVIMNSIGKDAIIRQFVIFCPAMAVTSTVRNGLAIGLAALLVQFIVLIIVSFTRSFISPRIQLPISLLIMSGLTCVFDLCMSAFTPDLYEQIGLFIQIIIGYTSIFAYMDTLENRNKPVASLLIFLRRGTLFLFALVFFSAIRELLTIGTIFNIPTLFNDNMLAIMNVPAGGFLTAGILIGASKFIIRKKLL